MSHSTIKRINTNLLRELNLQAENSERQRIAFNIHDSTAEQVQRFLNAMQPGTYVRPHRHNTPENWELTILLSGKIAILILDDCGLVFERIELAENGPERGIEIPARTWHTSAVLSPNTALLEIKPGPYNKLTDKEFADWAPTEGTPDSILLERRLQIAQPGEQLLR